MFGERTVISTIKKVMPAVVSIMVAKSADSLEKNIPQELLPFVHHGKHNEKRLDIPPEVIDKDGMVNVGGGSGFIVHSDGTIVTNKHVISDPMARYTVVLNDERKFSAEVLTRDPLDDVAILKIDATGLPTVKLSKQKKIDLGESVIAIGNALGIFKNTVSVGIVSGLSRSITAQGEPDAPPQEMRGLIQTDAAINPGNSGGPLVNLKGEAIAINAAIVFGAQNIGFAIPIETVRRDLEDLKKFGRVRRPLLGFRYIIADERLQHKLGLPHPYGAVVTRETPHDHAVVPGSPADHAGIREGDIVLACNGERVTTDHPIQDILEHLTVGDVMKLKVLRNGNEGEVSLTLGERK